MSEYYLADLWAEERAKLREMDKRQPTRPVESQDVKVTLLGDFMLPSTESQGCDPYNSVQGKASRDAWTTGRSRR